MIFTPVFVIFGIYFVWFLILSFFLFKFNTFHLKLVKSSKKESLTAILEEILAHEDENKKAVERLKGEYDKLSKDGASHIQKIGLVRFNPFKETGGDQSFILALVDSEDTGVVISSLHTRTGTRWYAKGVVAGKGVEYDLSDDERKALRGAKVLSEKS